MKKSIATLFKWLGRIPRFVASGLCFAAICYLTLVPRPLPDTDLGMIPGIDKIVHGVMFMGLSLCLTLDISRRGRSHWIVPGQRVNQAIAIATIVIGALIEWLQSAMDSGRSGDLIDLLADSVGAVIGVIIAVGLLRSAP